MKVARACVKAVCGLSIWDIIDQMKEKVQIFIDGANFYHLALKKLGINEIDFDFNGFANFLANGRLLQDAGKRIYVGTVREKEGDLKSKEAMSRQTSLFTILKNSGWEIKTSKLKVRVEEIKVDEKILEFKELLEAGFHKITIERFREKGIDVKLATDLIVGAIDKKYDTAIIVSSDSDLIPAIDWVRHRMNRKIEYVGFSILDKKNSKNNSTPLLSMISKTDVQRTLVESDIKKFVIQEKLLK